MDSDAFAPSLHSGGDIGQALKAVREAQGRSLEEVAEVTRIRRVYLADIEAMRLDKLPSRPFTIGYIRAYADATGDANAVYADGAAVPFHVEHDVEFAQGN